MARSIYSRIYPMARSIYNHFYTVFDWLWRRFGLVWRFAFAKFCSLVGYVRLALRWRSGERDDGRPEADSGARHGAADGVGAERLPGWNSEPAGRLPSPGGERPAEGLGKEVRVGASEWSAADDGDEEEVRVEVTDEFYCGYDSTWETEEDTRLTGATRPASFRSNKFRRFESAAKDMQNYRQNYPRRPQRWMRPASQNEMPNIDFYLGMMPSRPDGVSIWDFHDKWFGEYDALEEVHTYIQWLFPLQEAGMNSEAPPLTKEEIECFLGDPTAKENLFKSYLLMLDFYGITLTNKETGEVKRASNWEDRFRNMNIRTHNNLRITRILKCLGTLGFPQYQAPLVRFFLTETLVEGRLPNVKDSVLNYFVFAVLDKKSRRELIKFAFFNYDPNDEFVWCPKKLQRRWAREARALSAKGEGRTY